MSDFACLRCGFCCGGIDETGKRLWENKCPQLIERQRTPEGKWEPASCKIHEKESFPDVCLFCSPSGPEGICIIGLRIWRKLLKQFPEDNFPEEVAECLKGAAIG